VIGQSRRRDREADLGFLSVLKWHPSSSGIAMNGTIRIDEFRRRFQSDKVSRFYSGALHLAFIFGTGTAAMVYCILHIKGIKPLEWLILPATFLYANFVEYFAHRGPMHHSMLALRAVFAGHSLDHHRYFTNEKMELHGLRDVAIILFPPVVFVFFFGIFAFPVAFLLGWFISANAAYLFFATAMGYYLNYELFHLAYHLPEKSWVGRLPFMEVLRRSHTRHHDLHLMSKLCFNITYPICDWIFGTLDTRSPVDRG
jgi:hypothetical protein